MKKTEEVKRLSPKSNVLRELYFKSGNQCAFPGCNHPMVDEKGNFVGEVCHIEAAEPGGERFNPNMTNEERRSYDNLLLLCHQHHVVTDDVNEYTVEKLKLMKRRHEEKFSGIIERMKSSVVDYGYSQTDVQCVNCKAISKVLNYGCTDKENLENAAVLNTLLHKLTDLPIVTRRLLGIMVMRSYEDFSRRCIVPLHEIEAATGIGPEVIAQNIDILQRRGVTSEVDAYVGFPTCTLLEDYATGWPYWSDIRRFCQATGISIDTVCVDLNFSVFDEVFSL